VSSDDGTSYCYLAGFPAATISVAATDHLAAVEAERDALRAENDELHVDLLRVMEERNRIDAFATSLASMIGWNDTQGDGWLEKARVWRAEHDAMSARLAVLTEAAEKVVNGDVFGRADIADLRAALNQPEEGE
jgi:hypothetical protein